MKRRTLLKSLLLSLSLLSTPLLAQEKSLLIYCGITMVRPMTELARSFEQREKLRITISQGGTEDLYQSLKKSRQGDLYLMGEPSYRAKYLGEGLLGEQRTVGYNQLTLVVPKGNPKKVKGELSELLRKDLTIMIGNAESGSVGKETKDVLDAANLYPRVVNKAALLMPDSRAISLAMKRGDADLALNWRATVFFPDNSQQLEAVDLDPKHARPQALLLNLLTFSPNPALARKFMDYVASADGQAVFRKYGFLDNSINR